MKNTNLCERQNNQQEAKNSYPVFPPLAHHNPQSDSDCNCTVVRHALSVTNLKLTNAIVFLSSIFLSYNLLVLGGGPTFLIRYDYLQTNWGIHDMTTFFNMFFFTDYAHQLNDIKRIIF